MKTRLLRKLVTAVFVLFTIASVSLGIIVLISGYQNYDDPQVNTFTSTIVAVALILLPVTLLFIAKTVRSYRELDSKYGLPDLPARSLLLAGGTIVLLALIVVIIAIYFVLIQSPA